MKENRQTNEVVDKSKSSDYTQVTGHVKNEVAIKFKILCTQQKLTISEGVEKALKLFADTAGKQDEEIINGHNTHKTNL